MASKPCVSIHLHNFDREEGNPQIQRPKRDAEQTFWHAARGKPRVENPLFHKRFGTWNTDSAQKLTPEWWSPGELVTIPRRGHAFES